MDDTPRPIGLALGSGAARGAAHIGVLRALDEAGIRIDCIAGTSVGALVGAMYAMGTLPSLEELFQHLRWRQIVAFLDVIFPRSGLIDGRKVTEFIREHTTSSCIEELPLPFAAVSTDLVTGQEVVLRQGDLIEAIQASISIPGIFTPVRRGDSILVDGGLVNPVPVSVARAMGADLVIAVDLSRDVLTKQGLKERNRRPGRHPGGDTTAAGAPGDPRGGPGKGRRSQLVEALRQKVAASDAGALSPLRRWRNRNPLPNIFEVLITSLYTMQARIAGTNLDAHPADLLVRPPVGHIHFLDFQSAREAMDLGYQEARAMLSGPGAPIG